jgi:hypothetical protein
MYQTEMSYGPNAHFHNFYGPPWTLLENPEDVRTNAQVCNKPVPAGNLTSPGFWVPS